MKRPYLAFATFALVAGLTSGQVAGVRATGLFSSAPVESASFAVLARPVGDSDWSLVVLEQLRARPFCWTPRPDGLVDPSLNRFDYTGICGRFIDSNGYSLRIGDVDLNHAYRLRIERQGSELRLLATTASRGAELVVGRGTVPRRDRDLFVSLQLEPGWELRRRMFGDRSLNHLYFANGQPLDALMAAARGRTTVETASQGAELFAPPAAPPPLAAGGSGRVTSGSDPFGRGRERVASPRREEPSVPPVSGSVVGVPSQSPSDGVGSGVVALQVIPYEERGGEGRSRPASESLSSAQGQ
ncbi:MAG: DUF3747 domain-containing protein [Cyanobacteriota bacterium]|nr:DUF3747 domain-containing protein [Cyanobacteriota bacterium]